VDVVEGFFHLVNIATMQSMSCVMYMMYGDIYI